MKADFEGLCQRSHGPAVSSKVSVSAYTNHRAQLGDRTNDAPVDAPRLRTVRVRKRRERTARTVRVEATDFASVAVLELYLHVGQTNGLLVWIVLLTRRGDGPGARRVDGV